MRVLEPDEADEFIRMILFQQMNFVFLFWFLTGFLNEDTETIDKYGFFVVSNYNLNF